MPGQKYGEIFALGISKHDEICAAEGLFGLAQRPARQQAPVTETAPGVDCNDVKITIKLAVLKSVVTDNQVRLTDFNRLSCGGYSICSDDHCRRRTTPRNQGRLVTR